MTEMTERVNPLLQIDTVFRTYLNAYTRSCQSHVIEGNLDYAFESDFAVRQKILGLSGWNRLLKTIDTQDVSAEAKHLFLKCDQAGPLKYPDIYDIVKKCSERLELNQPIVFVRDDLDKELIYSISSSIIEPCIVLTKQLVDMCTADELTFLIGSECGRVQNNHCAFNMAFTYLNYNKYVYKPANRSYNQPVSRQLYSALVQWVKYADITANRAGMICLDNPGRYIDIVSGLFAKGYRDFYGRKQKDIDYAQLTLKAKEIHSVSSRDLSIESKYTELERGILAVNEFLYCQTLYVWRKDLVKDAEHSIESGQVCDVRTGIILGNGGQL